MSYVEEHGTVREIWQIWKRVERHGTLLETWKVWRSIEKHGNMENMEVWKIVDKCGKGLESCS